MKRYQIEPQAIAIGVSGGADSLALALLLHDICPDYKIIALTVDHGLRPSSHQEALYVAEVMSHFGIEHHILKWKGKKPTTGIEEKARLARYDLLYNWCIQHQVKYLSLAHHLLDQAETFLMRLERGSGVYGLSSMQDIVSFRDISLIRPLLYTHPQELKKYLKEKNISWVEDESNQCTDFLRVQMRQFLPLLQENTGITPERLCLAVKNLQRTRQFIDSLVQNTIRDKIHLWGSVGCSFDYHEFLSWHDELKFYVLRELIILIGGDDYMPTADALIEQIQQLKSADFSGSTLGHVYFMINDLRIWMIKEYRTDNLPLSENDWKTFEKENPSVRGVKIPYKLKLALFYEKKHEK